MMKMHGYRRVATTNPVNNPEGLAEDGECRSKSGDSIVKESTCTLYHAGTEA